MSPSHKRYSREFKLEVVRRVQVTSRSPNLGARAIGIAPNTDVVIYNILRTANRIQKISYCICLPFLTFRRKGRPFR